MVGAAIPGLSPQLRIISRERRGSLNTRRCRASKLVSMKTKLSAATLAIILAATGATALAHERYEDGTCVTRVEGCGGRLIRHDQPEVYYDRYGNPMFVHREPRHWIPIQSHYYWRPVFVEPECVPAPVYESRCRTHTRFEPHFVGALRFIFSR